MRSTLVCALLEHVRACSRAHDSHGELTDATLWCLQVPCMIECSGSS